MLVTFVLLLLLSLFSVDTVAMDQDNPRRSRRTLYRTQYQEIPAPSSAAVTSCSFCNDSDTDAEPSSDDEESVSAFGMQSDDESDENYDSDEDQ